MARKMVKCKTLRVAMGVKNLRCFLNQEYFYFCDEIVEIFEGEIKENGGGKRVVRVSLGAWKLEKVEGEFRRNKEK